MKANYGRLTRWVLRTLPYALQLEQGLDDERANTTTYILEEDKIKIPNLRLVVPTGIEVYQGVNLARISGDYSFFATKPDDNSSAYLCLVDLDLHIKNQTKNVFLTHASRWFDANISSQLLFKLLYVDPNGRGIRVPDKKICYNCLDERLGYQTLMHGLDVKGYKKVE